MDGFLDRYIGARFYYIWYTLLLPPHCDWGIIYCISTFLMTHSVSLCKAGVAAAALHGVVPVMPTGPIYVCPSWKVWTLAHKGTNGWNMSLAALLHCKKNIMYRLINFRESLLFTFYHQRIWTDIILHDSIYCCVEKSVNFLHKMVKERDFLIMINLYFLSLVRGPHE